MRQFKPDDRLSRNEKMLSTDLDQETILMSVDAGAYFGMAGTAQTIWEKLETPLTFSALVNELVNEFEITPEECASDLQDFLGKMEQEGLLHVEGP
jgi:hypothetical protein